MLSLVNEQQICVQLKNAKHTVYVVLRHMSTLPYAADLHANFPEKVFVEHVAVVRQYYSFSLLQLFIAERAMQ